MDTPVIPLEPTFSTDDQRRFRLSSLDIQVIKELALPKEIQLNEDRPEPGDPATNAEALESIHRQLALASALVRQVVEARAVLASERRLLREAWQAYLSFAELRARLPELRTEPSWKMVRRSAEHLRHMLHDVASEKDFRQFSDHRLLETGLRLSFENEQLQKQIERLLRENDALKRRLADS